LPASGSAGFQLRHYLQTIDARWSAKTESEAALLRPISVATRTKISLPNRVVNDKERCRP
jgi:hypothetical protein